MGRVMLWLLAIAMMAAGTILHAFYIDYESAAKGYIFSWAANDAQRAKVIGREARRLVRPSVTRSNSDVFVRRMEAHRDRWCRPTPAYYQVREQSRYFLSIEDRKYWRCEVEFDGEQVIREATRKIPGVTPEQALATTTEAYRGREIRHGMVPGQQVRGSGRASTALWLGIIVPLGLFAAALLAVIASLRQPSKIRETGYPRDAAEPLLRQSKPAGHGPYLADSLRSAFGPDFPVTIGDGTADDPLVITERRDYVSIEYAAVQHMLEAAAEEFHLDTQKLLHRGNRHIDEMVFRVRPIGAEEWTGIRRFYFDITEGFNRL